MYMPKSLKTQLLIWFVKGKREKRPMFTGLVAIFCQSSPPTRKSDIDFRHPLYQVCKLFIFLNVQKCKNPKNSKILKNDGHFQIPQLVFKHLQKCSLFFYFVGLQGGGKMNKFKKFKMVILGFCDILHLPHTVISNSEKLTHPTVYQC